jgi:hypothetical protein
MLVRKLRYLALLVLFVRSFDAAIAAASVSAAEARSIAKEVYIFGAAYVDNYRVYIRAPVDVNHLPIGREVQRVFAFASIDGAGRR